MMLRVAFTLLVLFGATTCMLPTMGGRETVQQNEAMLASWHQTRALQQTQPVCKWVNDSCAADSLGNVPDTEVLKGLVDIEKCVATKGKRKCQRRSAGCIWKEDGTGCTRDDVRFLERCLQPEWVTFKRGLECNILGSKRQCNEISGCVWDSDTKVCNIDEEAVVEAVGGNRDLSIDFATLKACTELPPERCDGSCTLDGEVCFYPPALDFARWFSRNATDPFCLYSKEVVRCAQQGKNCSDDCELKKTPIEECGPTEDALVEFAYRSDIDLQQRVKNGISVCPTLTTEDECLNYE